LPLISRLSVSKRKDDFDIPKKSSSRIATLIIDAGEGTHMSQKPDLASLSFTQRVVLLGLVDEAGDSEMPVTALEIKSRCTSLLDLVDIESLSTPGEQDIMRALNGLSADPAIEEHTNQQSPAGKGRPRYSLAADGDAILELLAGDDRLADAIDAVRK
jgi:hypothetical protein